MVKGKDAEGAVRKVENVQPLYKPVESPIRSFRQSKSLLVLLLLLEGDVDHMHLKLMVPSVRLARTTHGPTHISPRSTTPSRTSVLVTAFSTTSSPFHSKYYTMRKLDF
ncbi:hypothetical protein BOTNAR_0772g00010 [Botryotinia narcissicola]|uniref:Uncharacterized protein n=1 Tax=Botryotinia narcissicola TaxID=278944 RepID=A0A4Z1HHG4_9HELO|nr:hypothetical protein BOTNAR_0772g00010 [Botryotinia narcissicola]